MVSPDGNLPNDGASSLSGERFRYFTYYPYEGAGEGLYLLSTRTATGWKTQGVIPPQKGMGESDWFACSPSMYFSAELTKGLLADGWRNEGSYERKEECEGDEPRLVTGEPRGFANLFLRDNETSTYQLLDMPPQGVTPADALLADATPDLSHVLFTEKAALTPEAPPEEAGIIEAPDLYEWSNGEVHLVTFLPDGTPVEGALANGDIEEQGELIYVYFHSSQSGSSLYNRDAPFTHAMSDDGERVIFYANGDLFERLNATHAQSQVVAEKCTEPEAACTVQVDAAESGAKGSGGTGVFVYASADGSRVFFTDAKRLTTDSTAFPKEPDLYEYNSETGKLTDLTVLASEPANVLGFSGASEDGSYIYFVATGDLTGGQANSHGAIARAGVPNLYVSHEGVTTFIARLASEDGTDWQQGGKSNSGYLTTSVSPNGRFIAFNSLNRLTGFINEQAEPAECELSGEEGHCREIFRYDAVEGQLSCVSCRTEGARPTGPAAIKGPTQQLLYPGPYTLQHQVTDDGRVFFETADPLVLAATNGSGNVYEYENGKANLISTGSGEGESTFLDASPSGGDVFFRTAQGLVQSDTDNSYSAYDARTGGGFAAEVSGGSQAGPCESLDGCRSPLSEPPAEALASSDTFSGAGNLVVPPEPPVVAEKPPAQHRSLTRAQKLARALRACRHKPARKRRSCRARARKRFSPKRAKKGVSHGTRAVKSDKGGRR